MTKPRRLSGRESAEKTAREQADSDREAAAQEQRDLINRFKNKQGTHDE